MPTDQRSTMPRTIKIGDRLIGDGQPTYIIAEIGVNHNGFLDLALKLIDVAVEAGADAVKFQKRNLEKLYAKKYLENANSGEKTLRYLLPILQQVELPEEAYYTIVEYCRKRGITFLCSAFDADSADFLETLGVPAYKVASADLTNLPLLDHLVEKGQTAAAFHRHVSHARSRDHGGFLEASARSNSLCCTATAPIRWPSKISTCAL